MYEDICKDLDKELYDKVSTDAMSLNISFNQLLSNSLSKLENQNDNLLITDNSIKLAVLYRNRLNIG